MFYIGKEYILQSVDEHLNYSLSLMIDRIRSDFKGDPRYFLVERKFNLRRSSITIESEDVVDVVNMAQDEKMVKIDK